MDPNNRLRILTIISLRMLKKILERRFLAQAEYAASIFILNRVLKV
jgi:hypothetical protein